MQEISSSEVLTQLSNIVGSDDFTAGPRVKRFLKHLVSEELEGRGEHLRGTALAMDVFGRGGDFDSNNDPVVRIEAGKLRKALEHYYLTSGSLDEIRIDVPKGQYRPRFSKVQRASMEPNGQTVSAKPSIGVCGFDGEVGDLSALFCQGLPEEIALELSRFDNLRVYSGWSKGRETDGHSLAVQCDYCLNGSVRVSGSNIRITVQLTRLPDDLLIWSERFTTVLGEIDVFEIQEGVARQCATRIADAYGVVADDVAAGYAGRDVTDASVYGALLAFHGHLRTNRLGSLKEFVALAEAAVLASPQSGLAHALLALGILDQFFFGELSHDTLLKLGASHAEQAVALSPQGQEALFAGAVYALLQQDQARFQRLVDAAISVNPNGNLLIALAGGWIAILGEATKGGELVRKALESNPILPVWTNITLALEDVENEQFAAASAKLCNIDARDCANDWLLIAAMHALAGENSRAHFALRQFSRSGLGAEEQLSNLPMRPDLAEAMKTALRRVQYE